jgi:light-regulated signal transduction histidine kinase (bacteriophytochrome)
MVKSLNLSDNAAGIMIYFIERDKNEMLIWFRKEFDEHINWAGNPEKKVVYFLKTEKKSRWFPQELLSIFLQKILKDIPKMEFQKYQRCAGCRDLILETSHKNYNAIKRLNDELKK